jgi:hypothetical protein
MKPGNAGGSDPELLDLIHLRDEAVVHTEILVGAEGPNYNAI